MFSADSQSYVFFSSSTFELLEFGGTHQVKRAFAMDKKTRLCSTAYFSIATFPGEISLEDAIFWLNNPCVGRFVAESARQ